MTRAVGARRRRSGRFPAIVAGWSFVTLLCPALAQQPCAPPLGRVVSIQGQLDVKRAGSNTWVPVSRLNTPICSGDVLYAGKRSRAGVLLAPSTMVRLDQQTTMLLAVKGDSTEVELSLDERLARDQVGNVCGAAYVITRIPRSFRLKSPYISASVEGTEFQMALACDRARLDVYEGQVSVSSALASTPSILLTGGQSTSARKGEPPAAMKSIIKPSDAVQWTLYYPPLSVPDETASRDCEALDIGARPPCLVARAEQRLRAGRADEAEDDIASALTIAPQSSDAYALRAIIAVTKNDRNLALSFSQRAIELSKDSVRAWLSLSFALQATFQLEPALAAARRAVALEPGGAIVRSRVAELLLSLDLHNEALIAAREAVAAHPLEPRAHTVLGFSQLRRLEIDQSMASFERAIELDSASPLPRLGLGVAMVRRGQLAQGREQIEIAVALDPLNALLRSYVGKAYYEENTARRDELARGQLAQARALDPLDPTPDFYGAMLDQSRNHPIEALRGVQSSIVKNDNRAVYRSRLLLDEDHAARGASLAQIYQDAGFSQLAVTQAYRALELDAGNFAAHRYLSDAFSTLPRHQVAQTSELLQSELRKPLLLDPVPAYRNSPNLFIARGSGPITASMQELNPLFVSNGVGGGFEGIAGSMDTAGANGTLAVLGDGFAVRGGAFRYDTEGFRPNNDLSRKLLNVHGQAALTPDFGVQFEWLNSDFEFGDLPLRFDPTFVRTDLRNRERQDSVRLGARYVFGPRADLLLSAVQSDVDNEVIDTFGTVQNTITATLIEGQSLLHLGRTDLVVGGGHSRDRLLETFSGFPSPEEIREQSYGYTYASFDAGRFAPSIQVGVSVDRLDTLHFDRDEVNPKLGLILHPAPGTTLRAAYFHSVSHILPTSQTIEPTQVAGFNQVYFDVEGSLTRRAGIGVDQVIGQQIFAGVELSRRDLTVPIIDFFQGTVRDVDWHERQARAYLYWAPHTSLAFSLDGYYERFTRPATDGGVEEMVDVKTLRIPFGVSYFLGQCLTLRGAWTHWRQSGLFIPQGGLPGDVFAGREAFAVIDLQAILRLPNRKGFVSIGVNNLFDSEHRHQETDQFTPRYLPTRFFYVRASLAF